MFFQPLCKRSHMGGHITVPLCTLGEAIPAKCGLIQGIRVIVTADCKKSSLQQASWTMENHNWFIVLEQRGRAWWGRRIIRFIHGKSIVVFHCSAWLLQSHTLSISHYTQDVRDCKFSWGITNFLGKIIESHSANSLWKTSCQPCIYQVTNTVNRKIFVLQIFTL